MLKEKTILFDFFGVICTEIASTWFGQYLTQRPDLREKYSLEVDSGNMSEPDFFKTLSSLVEISPEEIRNSWLSSAVINDLVVKKIGELKLKYNIVLASNSPSPLIREILEKNNLGELFDKIIISAEIGLAKPNQNFFNKVIEILGQPHSDILFFDDNENNIKSAQSIGIESVLFSGPDSINIT